MPACTLVIGVQANAQEVTVSISENTPTIEEQLQLTPHPLADCERKKRKLTCDEMRTKGGFIINTNLRDSGRTIQYQLSAFSSVRGKPDFANGFEERVREHMRQAIPIAAKIMGWEPDAPETLAMIEEANAALDKMEISLEPMEASDESDYLARVGMAKEHHSAGSFYSNRSRIANSYSLYLWKPSFKKKQP